MCWGKGASGTVAFPEGLSFRDSGSRKWVGVCAWGNLVIFLGSIHHRSDHADC